MATYGGYEIENGNGVIVGRGEDRDCGRVLCATAERIEIAWDSGVRTTIDLLSHTVDDDSIEVYETYAAALDAYRAEVQS